VALKTCDVWQHPTYEEELLNEIKVYHALKDLQGDCIPRLKGAGYNAGGLFVIATDIVGKPLEDVENLSDRERRAFRRALSSIHHHGFIHNDIRKANILIKRDGSQSQAFFIDFAFSERGAQHDFSREMRSLKRLLGQ
jgi:tRNA A-37 threonylcarbamoyl transferase component Bud32